MENSYWFVLAKFYGNGNLENEFADFAILIQIADVYALISLNSVLPISMMSIRKIRMKIDARY